MYHPATHINAPAPPGTPPQRSQATAPKPTKLRTKILTKNPYALPYELLRDISHTGTNPDKPIPKLTNAPIRLSLACASIPNTPTNNPNTAPADASNTAVSVNDALTIGNTSGLSVE